MKINHLLAVAVLTAAGAGALISESEPSLLNVTVRADDKTTMSDKQLELLKTFAAEFVEITPGKAPFPASFQMGTAGASEAEKPAHEVRFGYSFQIAKYEVPQNLYEAVMGKNPSKWKGPRNSVEMFTAAEADEFCRRATTMMRSAGVLKADEEIRLPTEAEWEYCCRAGSTTKYSFGDEARKDGDVDQKASILNQYGWHTGNAAGNDPPVGALKPNAWGLYDMHGYLWEIVQDHWHDSYEKAPADGSVWLGQEASAPRVARGGSWREPYSQLTSTARRPIASDFLRDDLGFRCVRVKLREKS